MQKRRNVTLRDDLMICVRLVCVHFPSIFLVQGKKWRRQRSIQSARRNYKHYLVPSDHLPWTLTDPMRTENNVGKTGFLISNEIDLGVVAAKKSRQMRRCWSGLLRCFINRSLCPSHSIASSLATESHRISDRTYILHSTQQHGKTFGEFSSFNHRNEQWALMCALAFSPFAFCRVCASLRKLQIQADTARCPLHSAVLALDGAQLLITFLITPQRDVCPYVQFREFLSWKVLFKRRLWGDAIFCCHPNQLTRSILPPLFYSRLCEQRSRRKIISFQ